MGGTGRPCSCRSLRTFTRLMRLFTSAFTFSRPHSPSSSASSSSRVGAGSASSLLLLGLLPGRLGRRGGPGDEVPTSRGAFSPFSPSRSHWAAGCRRRVDKPGLLLADDVVHRREEQQHQGHQVHEPAGQLSAGHLVAGPHPGKEAGRLKAGVLRYRGGQLPEQNGGHRIPLGVHRVVVLHVAGGEGVAVPAPHAQRAGAEKGVRLGGKALPQRPVPDLTPEGGDALLILLVYRRSGHGTLHQASAPVSLNGSTDIISDGDWIINPGLSFYG